MKTAISRWGNSLALRLPKSLAEEANLKEGAAVDVRIEGHRVVIVPARRVYTLEELLKAYRPRHRRKDTDWGKPMGKEPW